MNSIFLEALMQAVKRPLLPRPLFLSITRNLTTGDPTWKLFIANEYLEKEHPLRKALTLRVSSRKDHAQHGPLLKAAISGVRYADLSEEEQYHLKLSATSLDPQQTLRPRPRRRAHLRHWNMSKSGRMNRHSRSGT